MDKFGRNYKLFVDTSTGETLLIQPPITLEFDISRKLLGSANHATFRLYNIKKESRENIRYNMYDWGSFRVVKLYAGYGDNLVLVFQGNIHEAWSVREGVNFITQIECYDAGFAYVNTQFNQSFQEGTNFIDVIKSISQQMTAKDKSVSLGQVSPSISNQKLAKGQAFSGSAVDNLNQIAANSFFVDNGKLNILQNTECLQGDVDVINIDTGLLGTPVFEQTILTFDLLFQPSLKVAQLVTIESETAEYFNGTYKINGIAHRGMISEAVCGDAVTTVTCFTGNGALEILGAA